MRVLVVEDHEDTRTVLTGLLTRWGHDVSSADTLKGGMARLETEPPVDVIVSDIALPERHLGLVQAEETADLDARLELDTP